MPRSSADWRLPVFAGQRPGRPGSPGWWRGCRCRRPPRDPDGSSTMSSGRMPVAGLPTAGNDQLPDSKGGKAASLPLIVGHVKPVQEPQPGSIWPAGDRPPHWAGFLKKRKEAVRFLPVADKIPSQAAEVRLRATVKIVDVQIPVGERPSGPGAHCPVAAKALSVILRQLVHVPFHGVEQGVAEFREPSFSPGPRFGSAGRETPPACPRPSSGPPARCRRRRSFR